MIVLDLSCEQGHQFEAWFASSEAFEDQLQRGLVSCPSCGSLQLRRLPSAPYVRTSGERPASGSLPKTGEVLARLVTSLRAQAQQAEDVGERFPEEVRRIHHGEAEERAVKGQASGRELLELLEEGISVLPVPPAKEDLH